MEKRISVCITVMNEEQGIEALLYSLLEQTLTPLEIVICDGGSTDTTVSRIKKLQTKNPIIKLVISKGNVAHGRNTAIEMAKGDSVATIDAGCIAKKDWLAKLASGMKNADIAAGFYEMKYKNAFQKGMALYRGTHPARYDAKTFMPSCRSVAFTKKMWQELGGFNETLSLSGEDTQFFYKAIMSNKKITRVQNALVEWREPENFSLRDFKKFFYYAKGDAQTAIWWDKTKRWKTHNIKILSIFARYVLLICTLIVNQYLFVFFVCSYFLWTIYKWSDVVTKWNERLWLPIIQVGTDAMVMSGFAVGIMASVWGQKKL